jgi:hypothetical protein
MSVSLFFNGNAISGGGTDVDGHFMMDGEYFPEMNRVMLEKRYDDLTSHYDGRWDGQLIAGHWSFSILYVSEDGVFTESDRGPFELWPLEHEHELDLDAQPLALPEPIQAIQDRLNEFV